MSNVISLDAYRKGKRGRSTMKAVASGVLVRLVAAFEEDGEPVEVEWLLTPEQARAVRRQLAEATASADFERKYGRR